jgi:carbamoyltransferase
LGDKYFQKSTKPAVRGGFRAMRKIVEEGRALRHHVGVKRANVILGVGSLMDHDPSAALLVEGRLVAAAEEERFCREKHARRRFPLEAARYCLADAGLAPRDVEVVAVPWSERAYRRHMWAYARRAAWSKPSHAWKAIAKARERNEEKRRDLTAGLAALGIDAARVEVEWVEHHLAHASSAYHLAGFDEAAILTIDGKGEFTATMLARGRGAAIEPVREILSPDSLGLFYATITEFLGFESHDGEFKVMGMAAYGDAARADLAPLLAEDGRGGYRVNDALVWVRRGRRVGGKRYSARLVELLGPPREDDDALGRYADIAAAAQAALERIAVALVERHLAEDLARHGTLCLAGGCALNVRMNQRLLAHPLVKRIFVQPAANDAGTALGAASFAAAARGARIEPMRHAYWGPAYDRGACRRALESAGLAFEEPADMAERAAEILAQGSVLAWFQGRMELGPRALGARSILAHPGLAGMADRINAQVKFRERWRPFCPSILAARASEVLGAAHEAPFMTISFDVAKAWRERIGEAVHVDGTARPQVVDAASAPLFHRVIERFEARAGLPALLNTSLNRRGEPIAMTPEDAVRVFRESGLEALALGPFLARKPAPA